MLIKTAGNQASFTAVIFFVITWWIINEFDNLLSKNNIMNLITMNVYFKLILIYLS